MANTDLVACGNENVDSATSSDTSTRINIISTKQPERKTPTSSENATSNVSLIREKLKNQGFSTTVTHIMEASWRTGTRKQYESTLSKWKLYCSARQINPFSPAVEEGINFLGELYDQGIGYSGINTARSALSSILILPNNWSFGNHPSVCRFLKGVYETRPTLPKHQEIWDVNTVLDFLKTLHPVEELNLKDLTLKLIMLLALTSAQRCQTLQAFSLENMKLTDEQCIFYFTKLLKTSRPGKHQPPIIVKAFTPNVKICPINVLKKYVEKTKPLRGKENQLLISYQQPHKRVKADTISRWLKAVLERSGITNFTGHSTRAASSSAAKRSNMDIATILEAAGWSNATTFTKFYNKPLLTRNNFGQALLDAFPQNS